MRRLLIVRITGGSGSGKATISQNIINQIGRDKIAFIQHDWYYKDRRRLSPEEIEKINYDCLEAFENDLFLPQLKEISRVNLSNAHYMTMLLTSGNMRQR